QGEALEHPQPRLPRQALDLPRRQALEGADVGIRREHVLDASRAAAACAQALAQVVEGAPRDAAEDQAAAGLEPALQVGEELLAVRRAQALEAEEAGYDVVGRLRGRG